MESFGCGQGGVPLYLVIYCIDGCLPTISVFGETGGVGVLLDFRGAELLAGDEAVGDADFSRDVASGICQTGVAR